MGEDLFQIDQEVITKEYHNGALRSQDLQDGGVSAAGGRSVYGAGGGQSQMGNRGDKTLR